MQTRVIADLDEGLKEIEDEQAQVLLNVFRREWEKNSGKGFVQFNFDECAKYVHKRR